MTRSSLVGKYLKKVLAEKSAAAAMVVAS